MSALRILLCGSVRRRDALEAAAASLRAVGMEPVFPDGAGVPETADELRYRAALAHEHYAAMREADAVYFVLPEGRMGTSVTLELGYAAALGKPIFFSEPTGDPALDHYPLAVMPIGDVGRLPGLISAASAP